METKRLNKKCKVSVYELHKSKRAHKTHCYTLMRKLIVLALSVF